MKTNRTWAAMAAAATLLMSGCDTAKRPTSPGQAPFVDDRIKRPVHWINPGPTGENLHAVSGRAADDVYAVGTQRTILHWNGRSWATLDSPWASGALNDVWADPNGLVYAVGLEGWILRGDVEDFVHERVSPDERLYGVWGVDGVVFAAGAVNGQPLLLQRRGDWQERDIQTPTGERPTGALRGIWASAFDDVFVVGDDGVWHFGGLTWSHDIDPSGSDIAVWGSGPDDVYVVTSAETWRFDGVTWTEILGVRGRTVTGTGPDDVHVVGNGGAYHFDGTSWRDVPIEGLSGLFTILDVWAESTGRLVGVGNIGATSRFESDRWVVEDGSTLRGVSLTDIGSFSTGELIVVGRDGGEAAVARGTNALVVDYVSTEPLSPWALAVLPGDDVIAVGTGARHLYNDGAAWSMRDIRNGDHRDVWGRSASDLLVVGGEELLEGFEGEWTLVMHGFGDDLSCVWGTDTHAFIGTGTGLAIKDNGPWQHKELGRKVLDIDGRSATDVWFMASPSLGQFELGHFDGADFEFVPIDASLSPFGKLAVGENAVYVASGGGILVFDGSTWQRRAIGIRGLPVGVVMSGPNQVAIASTSGYVVRVDDEGSSRLH